MKKSVTTFLVCILAFQAWSCTTIISWGKYTKDGPPILSKHRDTGTTDNALTCFTDGRYDSIGPANAFIQLIVNDDSSLLSIG